MRVVLDRIIKELVDKMLKVFKLKYLNIFILGILSTFLVFGAYSHTYNKDGLEIIHPWCESALSGENSTAYLTISNDSETDISLIGISSEYIHHIMLMKDDKSVDNIIIPGNGGIRGEDDFSVMFHGLKDDLVAGENIPAVLEFSSGMVIDIKFVIGENTTLDEDQDMNDSKEHHDHSHH